MIGGKKIAAFVPVKSTSERVSSKNTRSFKGEPLFVFTVKKLLKCEFIDEVYVDSECDDILKIAEEVGALTLKRSADLASNKTDGNVLFYNEVSQVDADIYIQHLCTSPFIKESTIQQGVDILNNETYDSVVLGESTKKYKWCNNRPVYDIDNIPNSVDLEDDIFESMGLYFIKSESAHKLKRRVGEKPKMIFGEPIELLDINNESDLDLASLVVAGLLSEEERGFRLISKFLSSPILSDVLDDMGVDSVLPPEYVSNIAQVKMMGRARPIHIREVVETDPPDSIYDALNHYEHVVNNDILIVKNDCPQLAYFGDLNMSLAIRAGACGAIIGGVTRDNKSTSSAGFPVFAKGKYCRDIKGRGAVKSINRPIVLDGVSIRPSDLIFADEDGVVVVPYEIEAEVIQTALEKSCSEKDLVSFICKGSSTTELVNNFGFF